MELLDLAYAMGNFTMSVLKKVVKIKAKPDMGFRQFFKDIEKETKGVKFWVKREGRRTAVDINVYEKGHLIRSDKSTQKNFIPANYNEKFDYSALEEFESIEGEEGQIPGNVYMKLVEATAEGVAGIEQAFDRAEERMCAQVLLTGVVTLKNGDNIDFKRKSESIVAYNAAHDFSIDTVNPETIFVSSARFIIKEGKYSAGTRFICIMGLDTFIAFKNNPIVQDTGNLRRMEYLKMSTGEDVMDMTPQGEYSAGSYKFNIWTYEGYYDDPDNDNTTTTYMDPKAMIIMPNAQMFDFVYCATKAMTGKIGERVPRTVKGKRNHYRLESEEDCSVQHGVRSACIPILTEVDSVVTVTVLE